MSLVDYASSSDEEEAEVAQAQDETKQSQINEVMPGKEKEETQGPLHNPLFPDKASGSSSGRQRDELTHQPQALGLKLPDASLLLNSPAVPSHMLHAARVAITMAESASHKRDFNGPSSSYPRNKVPKGTLPHPKSAPDTARGLLLPPQLTGRSNVVTEDITKLFVKKHVDSSS